MKKLSIAKLGLIGTLLAIGFNGCANRLGNMTIASTKNINGLNIVTDVNNTVTGKSCIGNVLFIPFGDFQNRLQIATDNAIENGHKRGLKGDVLINTKIDINQYNLIIFGQNCLNVKGDLIELQDSMKR
jgi:hypothetical protein